ncbi:MAG: hypothetical protein AABX31_00370 [Nanoarchaeota archaeon]
MKPIPESVTVITGDQHLVQQTIDDFFVDTTNYIKNHYGLKPGPNCFRIDSGEIAYSSLTPGDDRVTYLTFLQRVVATVMEVRTDSNYVQYTFFRSLEGIEELVEIHNHIYEVK